MVWKTLLKLGLGLIALGGIGVGVAGWQLQQQLTQVPVALQPIPASTNTYERHQALQTQAIAAVKRLQAQSQRQSQPQSQRGDSVAVNLSTEDLNALLAFGLATTIEAKGAKQIVQATQVEIQGESLKTSALLDLSQVSSADLEKIPGLTNRPIYVAAQGKPVVRDRALSLQDLTLTVGGLHLTLADAAQYLGVSEAILQEALDRELRSLPIDLDQVQVVAKPADSSASTANPSPTPGTGHLEVTGSLTAW
jgi:hypothetical protein